MPEPRTFAAYLDRTERDQLDARAATAEQERDEALDARDVLRHRLNTAREDAYRDIARQIDILAADPGILRDWLTTCHPQPISFGELFHALAEKLRRPTPPSSVPSRRAQEPQPGQFCAKHFSWLCQAGQGRCQNDAENAP